MLRYLKNSTNFTQQGKFIWADCANMVMNAVLSANAENLAQKRHRREEAQGRHKLFEQCGG